jgi:hypothetical protein
MDLKFILTNFSPCNCVKGHIKSVFSEAELRPLEALTFKNE